MRNDVDEATIGRTIGRCMRGLRLALVACLLAALMVACAGDAGDDAGDGSDDGLGDAGDCTEVHVAVSSEKIDLMVALARSFNNSDHAETDEGCSFVRPYSKASGNAAELLATSWPEDGEGPRPTIWSPAASSWGQVANQRLSDAGREPVVGDFTSFMLTPLVIAMPEPMATALGYPETPIGWEDIVELSTSEEGWAAHGHPEWGAFKLGKTNPNFSTSGLSALIGQAYAGAGKTRGLSMEDLDNPTLDTFAREIESSVVHYGDITMTFLNNWFRTDREGTSLLYASAVAVEEKSVIDYNLGNPDGVLEPGERPEPPRIPLVAIYPKEGTIYSDNPLYVVDADWVTDDHRQGAEQFIEFVQQPENQEQVLEFGFRPGNPDVAVAAPIVTDNGVDPDQPSTLLQVPEPPVMVRLLDNWREQRKEARVLLVLDVSGSMKDQAVEGSSETKLDLAQRAAVESLDQFTSNDQVGLRIFTTGLGPSEDESFLDILEIQPMGANREALANEITDQFPRYGTPLYDVTRQSFTDMVENYDEDRINAIVLLTDGRNEDGDTADDEQQLRELLDMLEDHTTGEQNQRPVRIFPIAYGRQADMSTLEEIAEATDALAYDASDPATITKVFTAVISNF